MPNPTYRLYAEIRPELSANFRQATKTMLATATRGLEVKVDVKPDLKQFNSTMNVLRRPITVALKIDDTLFRTRLAALTRPRTVSIKAVLDASMFRTQLAALTTNQSVTINANLNTAALRAQLLAISNQTININTNVSGGNAATRGLGSLASFGLTAAGAATALKGAAVALVPVLASVGASAGVAAGGLLAAGPAALGAAAAFGAAKLAFGGVLDVHKLHTAAEEESAAATTVSASAQRTRQRAIQSTQSALVASTRAIADAERNVGRAQDRARLAQNGVNRARAEALRDLIELRELVSDYAQDEEGAAISVERARENLNRVNADASASALDRREAAHELASAEERLNDVQVERTRAVTKLEGEERKGVNRADKVIDAQREQQEALLAVVDAQRAVRDAVESQTEAQRALADAQAQANEETVKATPALSKFAREMAKHSPEFREFVNTIIDLKPAFQDFRNEMEAATLPGFTSFLRSITTHGRKGYSTLSIVQQSIADMGREFSLTAEESGKFFKSDFFQDRLIRITANNWFAVTSLGNAFRHMLNPLTRIFDRSSPLVVRFADAIEGLAIQFDGWITRMDETGKLETFFQRAGDNAGKFWDIIKNVGETLWNIIDAADKGTTEGGLLDTIVRWTDKIKDWSGSAKGQEAIKDFFKKFGDLMAKLKPKEFGETVKSLIVIFGAVSAVKFAASHPIFALFAVLSAKYPDETRRFINDVADGIIRLGTWADEHEKSLLALIAFFAALKGLAALGAAAKGISAVGSAVGGIGTALGFGSGAAAARAAGTGGLLSGVGPAAKKFGGSALKFGGKVLGRGGAVGIAGAGVGIAADQGVFGDKGSAGKAAGQAGGAILSGAGAGALIGSVVPGVGTLAGGIVGAIGGAIYSFFQSSKLRDMFMENIGGPIADFFTKTVPDFFKELPGKIGDFFKSVPGKIGDAMLDIANLGGKIVGWIIVGIVKGIPFLFEKFTGMVTWINDKIGKGLSKAVEFFRSLPGRAWEAAKDLGPKIGQIVDTSVDFFRKLPGRVIDFIKGLPDQVWGVLQKIPKFFEWMWNAAKDFVVDGVNGVIKLINSFLKGVESVTGNFDVHVMGGKKHDQGIPLIKKATGGYISGPGGPTEDRVPALLSNGEYVVRASAVKSLGKGVLDYINRSGDVPRFANGGSIEEIIAVARRSGLPLGQITTNPGGYMGAKHSDDGGLHSRSLAVDFGRGGVGQENVDKLAAYFMEKFGRGLRELIHTRADGRSGWYVKNKQVVKPAYYGSELANHINHVHAAADPGFSGLNVGGWLTRGLEGLGSVADNTIGAVIRGLAKPMISAVKGKAGFIGKTLGGVMEKFTKNVIGKADTGQPGGFADGYSYESAHKSVAGMHYADLFNRFGQQYGVPPAFLAAIASQETNFNPAATSPVGAQGLMQFMPGTWREWGTGSPYNPTNAVQAGAKYIKWIMNKWGGNLLTTAYAYNAGPNRSSYPAPWAENQNYGPSVMRKYNNYQLNGFANGGVLAANQLAIVGERGPELLQVGSSSRVYSNQESRGIGSSPINLDVHVYVGDREITDIVRVEVDRKDARDARRFNHGRTIGLG